MSYIIGTVIPQQPTYIHEVHSEQVLAPNSLKCGEKKTFYIVVICLQRNYIKTPPLRPPLGLRKNGLYSGMVLLLS